MCCKPFEDLHIDHHSQHQVYCIVNHQEYHQQGNQNAQHHKPASDSVRAVRKNHNADEKHCYRDKTGSHHPGDDRKHQLPDPRVSDLSALEPDLSCHLTVEIITCKRDKRKPGVIFPQPFSYRVKTDRMENISYQCKYNHNGKYKQVNG